MLCGLSMLPGFSSAFLPPAPYLPQDVIQSPHLFIFAMREFTYPSLTKMLSSGSHATSVGLRNQPSTGTAADCFKCSSCPESYPSGRRPRLSTAFPDGSNLMTESVPLSTTQRLSYLSKRT